LVTAHGVARFREFVERAADLVVSYGGSLSGEHGDGQARGELLPRMFGEAVVHAFGEVKAVFDPQDRMNPGKVVAPYRLDENLRLGADYAPWDPSTEFGYPQDGGSFSRAVLRCVGVGKCRREGGGVMCPSYMVTREEEHSTRGRARLLFEMLQGEVITDGWRSAAVNDALNLCLACKGCKTDCPVNVDMATYKAEFLYHYYRRRLRPRSHYSMGWLPLWDLKARLLGLPLHRLLGAARDAVPVYASGGFVSYDDDRTRAELTCWVQDQRIPRVKIKIGESGGRQVERDLRRSALARAAVGDSVELYVDANGGYSRKQAVRVGAALADLGVGWFEEPVSSDDLEGLRLVRDRVPADVAAGEYGFDLTYFRRMCQAAAVDCLQADVTRCGGITEWLRAAAVAASFGLEVSAHCAPHAHAAVAASAPNLRHIEWFHDHVRVEAALFDGSLDPAGGCVRPDPDRPGLGLSVRLPEADRYRVA
jgi:L-alanine-DL-glutamate epimerase-like enolase superfamily enzyme